MTLSKAVLAIGVTVAATFLGTAAAASAYCGSLGQCAAGATPTHAGKVSLGGDGYSCVWECVAPDSTPHPCTEGSAGSPCAHAQGHPAQSELPISGPEGIRDGVRMSDQYRVHNTHILQAVEGESWRVCSHRVDGQEDVDILAPFAQRFGWGWTPPLDWTTWSTAIDDACYQAESGVSFRPVFLKTEPEFHSYLRWANARDVGQAPGAREIEGLCLFLFESDTTRRARYVAGSPTGEQTDIYGQAWVAEASGGGCPADGQAWECLTDMSPPLVAGDTIDGLFCGTPPAPTPCTNRTVSPWSAWSPSTSTYCSGHAFTQSRSWS